MKINYQVVFLFMIGLFVFNNANALNDNEIKGVWINQGGDGLIEISKNNGKYQGIILGNTDPNSPDRQDINNPDSNLQERDLRGLKILGDLSFDGEDQWEGGWVYDPNNGNTYKCKITMKNSNTLVIRGYIGISLFGRTEEWTRKTNN